MEPGILLPAFEKGKGVDVHQFGDVPTTQTKIVTLPTDMLSIQQIYNGRPLQATKWRSIVARHATRGSRPQSNAIGKGWPKLVGEEAATQGTGIRQRIVPGEFRTINTINRCP